MTTGTMYFVLREGSTREEQCTWEEIESLCRSGELSAQARIFLPEENRWAELRETRFGTNIAAKPVVEEPEDEAVKEATQKLEAEYNAALERIEATPDELEAHLDAGIIAAQLVRREEARRHFQSVLDRYPYHARVAQEVKRRFPRNELRTFRYLDRPAPIWEDLGELAAMPLARGPLFVVIPAVIIAGLSFFRFGGVLTSALMFLWMFQVMEYTARGANQPPDWDRSFADPWGKLFRPMLLMSVVAVQMGVIVFTAAKVVMLIEGVKDQSLWSYIAASPIFVVAASVVLALYLPAAFVSIGGFAGPVTKTLDPRRLVKTIIRMEHEYIYTVVLVAGIGVAAAIACGITAGVPVAGNLVRGAVLAYATPCVGLVLGRLLGRVGQVIA
jgi:Protein of unknown function (DUF4013)